MVNRMPSRPPGRSGVVTSRNHRHPCADRRRRRRCRTGCWGAPRRGPRSWQDGEREDRKCGQSGERTVHVAESPVGERAVVTAGTWGSGSGTRKSSWGPGTPYGVPVLVLWRFPISGEVGSLRRTRLSSNHWRSLCQVRRGRRGRWPWSGDLLGHTLTQFWALPQTWMPPRRSARRAARQHSSCRSDSN